MGTNPTARQRAISNRLKFFGRFSRTDRGRTQSDGASILKLTTPLQGWLLSRCRPRCRAKLRKVLYLQGFSSLRQRKQRRNQRKKQKQYKSQIGQCSRFFEARCRTSLPTHTLSGFSHLQEVSNGTEHNHSKSTQGSSGRNIQYEDGQHHLCHRRSFQQDEP